MNSRAFFWQRPLIAASLAYAAGVLCALPGDGFSIVFPLMGAGVSMAALAFLFHRPALRVVCVSSGFFFLGLLLGNAAAHPSLPPEGAYLVEGRITGKAHQREEDGRAQAELRDVVLTAADGTKTRQGGAYWTWYPDFQAPLPGDGDRVSFAGNVYHPSPQMNPYGFDFRLYLLERGIPIGVSGFDNLVVRDEGESVAYRVREAISGRLDTLFGAQSGLARALLIGDREGLSDQVRADFRDAGIAHVLSVSGLHVSFFVVGLFYALRVFRLSPWARFWVVATFLLLFCTLLSFQAAVVRAAILSSLLLMGRALKRRADPLTSLSAAFLLLLFARPLDLRNVGFQLSFLAVLGIFTLGDLFSYWMENSLALSRLPKILRAVLQAYAVTLSASALIFVPIVNTFHRFPWVSLLIGPPACLLVGVLMAGFFLSLPLSLMSFPLAQALAWPVTRFSEFYQAFAACSASLFGLTPVLAHFSWVGAGLFLALPLGMTRYNILRARGKLLFCGAMTAALVILFLLPGDSAVRYTQLSVGNADSAVMLDGKTTWVMDAGENGGDLASYLQSMGRGVDLLLFTHLHADHTGGLRQLLDSGVRIGQICIPRGAYSASAPPASVALLREAQTLGIPVREVAAGDGFESARVSARVLWPGENGIYPGSEANDSSIVLLWDLAGTSMLTTGDVGVGYAKYAYQPAQVMKIPHHGSKAELDLDNLRLVSPLLALISASDARPDRYSASHQALGSLGTLTFVTGETGALTLRVHGGEVSLTAHTERR